MKDNNKIVKKIKGLLAIAKDHKNDEESQSAFLLAQRLMIKYQVNKRDVELLDDEVELVGQESVTIYKRLYWWERTLGNIIAKNFRVKMFYSSKGSGHKTKIVFYGYGGDLELAKEMYFLAYEVLLFHSKQYIDFFYEENEVTRESYFTESLKASYIQGFLSGLAQRFEEQVSVLTETYEVMVLIPKEVEDSYKEFSTDFGSYSVKSPPISVRSAFDKGYEKAKSVDFTRSTVGTDYSFLIGQYIKFNQGTTQGLIACVEGIKEEKLLLTVMNETLGTINSFYTWGLEADYHYEVLPINDPIISLFERNKKTKNA